MSANSGVKFSSKSFARRGVMASAGLWERGSGALASDRVFPHSHAPSSPLGETALSTRKGASGTCPAPIKHRAPKAPAISPSGDTLSLPKVYCTLCRDALCHDLQFFFKGIRKDIEFVRKFFLVRMRFFGVELPCAKNRVRIKYACKSNEFRKIFHNAVLLRADNIEIRQCIRNDESTESVFRIFASLTNNGHVNYSCSIYECSSTCSTHGRGVFGLFFARCFYWQFCCSIDKTSSHKCSQTCHHTCEECLEALNRARNFRTGCKKCNPTCSNCHKCNSCSHSIQLIDPSHTCLPRSSCMGGAV